jgi:hypothetical protein
LAVERPLVSNIIITQFARDSSKSLLSFLSLVFSTGSHHQTCNLKHWIAPQDIILFLPQVTGLEEYE